MKEQQFLAAYEPPKVEIIEVEVEKGFSGSLEGSSAVGDPIPGGGSTSWPD